MGIRDSIYSVWEFVRFGNYEVKPSIF